MTAVVSSSEDVHAAGRDDIVTLDDPRPEVLGDPKLARRAFRLDTALPLRVRVADGLRGTRDWPQTEDGEWRVLDTVTEDLSIGGLRFRAPHVLARGETVEVDFDLDDYEITLDAKVAHAEADPWGAGIGIEFVNTERNVATSLLSRYLFALERERLPRVLVMYAVRCAVTHSDVEVRGATEECSRAFVQLLLEKSVEPTRAVALSIAMERSSIRLFGTVVKCREAMNMWRVSIELDDPVPQRWADVVAERKSGIR